jgi:Rrf2 family protein
MSREKAILDISDATIRFGLVLRLSNRGRYAVRALFDLAFHEGRPAQVRDVAARQRIPQRFLEQILQALKRAGLVESKRGPRGGFTLARPAEDVRLGDVLRAVEGPVALAPARRPKRIDLRDVPDFALADLGKSVEKCFDDVTLSDLCARGRELGLEQKEGTASPRYVI